MGKIAKTFVGELVGIACEDGGAIPADSIPDKVKRYLARHDAGELTMAEVARLCQCSRTTLYKYQNLLQSKAN